MPPTQTIICDGCGQPASPQHITRRLQRLEWTTRFRPVHIGSLLLSAVAPENDSDFLYAPLEQRRGEAQMILEVAGVSTEGRTAEAVLSDFQRSGLFLVHVVECPIEITATVNAQQLLEQRLPVAMTRIRRSLRPKRLAVISAALAASLPTFETGNLGCTLLLDQAKPFVVEPGHSSTTRLSEVLRAQNAARLSAS